MSTIILTEGTIVSPLGPDLRPDTSGYDNAGLFGPSFTNLGGDRFTIEWTLGPLAGPSYGWVQDVTLTINGFTYDFGAVPPGDQVSAGGQYGINAHGDLTYASFSSFLSTLPTGAPNFAGPSPLASYEIHILPRYAPNTDIGWASLEVRGHPWETVVNFAVPNSELGTGWFCLAIIPLLWFCKRERAKSNGRGTGGTTGPSYTPKGTCGGRQNARP